MKNMHHSTSTEFSLFVGDLPQDCSDDKLQRLFTQKFKSVKRVQIIRHDNGLSRGFGFIRFEDQADFQAALSQEMKIGNVTLRLDTAHSKETRYKNRSRYSSFNSTSNNNNNHHSHNFNSGSSNHHHPHHHNQHHHQSQQQQNPNKNLHSDSSSGIGGTGNQQHNSRSSGGGNNLVHHHASGVTGSGGGTGGSNSSSGHHHSIHHQQHPHHNTHSSHNNFGFPQHNNTQHQSQDIGKNPKQPNNLGDNPGQQTQQQSQQPRSQPPSQHNLQQANSSGGSSTIASSSNSSANLSSAVSNNHNLNTSQQAIGPDMRGYSAAATMMDTHVLSTTDQPSMMPPTSVYGHLYSYGPPPFGYMPPPPQPNPVIPISAVPPAPPNQASPSAGVNQPHGHSMTATTTTRYSGGGQHHHQAAPSHGATDGTMSTMPSGVQVPHQGPPLYYYYHPSPLYFDQAGGAAAPPSIYHTQPFHPQFFAMPNPAYMSNAHTFNQHQPQPPTASLSDATVINQQQSHQLQVNMRTRDIDTTIE